MEKGHVIPKLTDYRFCSHISLLGMTLSVDFKKSMGWLVSLGNGLFSESDKLRLPW